MFATKALKPKWPNSWRGPWRKRERESLAPHAGLDRGWGELYDGWEKDIPPQYEHRGPSLAEEAEREKQARPNQCMGGPLCFWLRRWNAGTFRWCSMCCLVLFDFGLGLLGCYGMLKSVFATFLEFVGEKSLS